MTSLLNHKTTTDTAVRRDVMVGVAMSGGVDSSVAAALLAKQGYTVIGLTMHLWTDEKGQEMSLNRASGCCSITMTQDAASVADRIGFKHYVLNMSDEFHGKVVKDFGGEYLRGRTPNPCVRCNTYIKWQALLGRAQTLGCDFLATGHYARVERSGERLVLRKAESADKDQSYALWGLSQESLRHTMFPLGDLEKSEVRQIARELELVTADKPESQDICFVPDNNYRRFLSDNFGSELQLIGQGEIIGPDGNVVGRHDGVSNFTVGQRKGLGITTERPVYVTRIEPATRRVFVDFEENCFGNSAEVRDLNWVSVPPASDPFMCQVKVRYRDLPHSATIYPNSDSSARIEFHEPVRAITPGQSAVFYDGDILLGGGILCENEETESS